jgi:hypothetical protein
MFRRSMRSLPILTAALLAAYSISLAQDGGYAGAYSRLGFGARGMGMGNAMTAVSDGDLQTYYNPALAAFASNHDVSASYDVLSLDRSLNFLSYTQSLPPTAGFSFGLINSGVSNIDGRDGDGVPTGPLTTTEDQVYLAFANRMTDRFSVGGAIKLYYGKLYDQITSTTVGFDIGVYYQLTEQLSIGGALQDIGSKYSWNSQSLYQENGTTQTDDFPTLRRIGASYDLDHHLILAADYENSSDGSDVMRFGGEYRFVQYFTVRAGIDRVEFSSNSAGAKPTFGFTVSNPMGMFTPELTYAYVFEPFAPAGMDVLTLSALF